MLRLACANTNQRRQWQPLPWHCYSAAGAPADTKATTRLAPRRDNRRDRDVAAIALVRLGRGAS
jgi:hypothetical protein